MAKSKKYQVAAKKVSNRKYTLEEAFALLPELSISNFPGSISVEILLNLKDKQKKETIRGSYSLPNKFGNEKKILVFADANNIKAAEKADFKGDEKLIPDVESGKFDFDVVIATPTMMPKIARLGKTLGVRGLMPNPKNGTITTDLEATIAKFKSGLNNFKMKDVGKINGVIGKVDMNSDKLIENFNAFYQAIFNETKKYGQGIIKSILLTPTMGPSISIDLSSLK